MTLCEKCVHQEVCNIRDCHDEDDEKALTYCADFKNKADFVEVVRCKDCGHWGGVTFGNICRRWTGLNVKNCTSPNDFCSYGERKDT